MPPKSVDATVIILDIGRNCAQPQNGDGKSFFDLAKAAVIRIIERKIISRPDDLLSVILLGSKKTNNELAEQSEGSYQGIDVLWDLMHPQWQMIQKLPNKASKYEGDWLESLIVAFERLTNGVSGLKPPKKKIVLFTNFKVAAEGEAEKFIEAFQQSNAELNVIGPDLTQMDNDKIQTANIELAQQFVEASDGLSVTFDALMHYLMFHRSKATRPSPWNVDLNIGPNIKIPVSAYCRIREENSKIKWQRAVKDPITGTASSTAGIVKKETYMNTDTNMEIDKADVIKGYRYGESIIPLSEDDKATLYNPGPKCLSIYGFADAKQIGWQCFADGGLSYLFGRNGNDKAITAIRSLIYCMKEMDLVGIARRVYNNGNAPKMFALFPLIDGEYFCLSMATLCFKEDIKNMAFPTTNLKQYSCEDKQVSAFKTLIEAMDLTKAYNGESEAFQVPETVNPAVQYELDCISFRAVNPGAPLPQPRDDIINLFKLPPSIEVNSREPIRLLKELFPLRVIERKKKRTGKNLLQTSSTDVKSENNDSTLPKINVSFNVNKEEEVLNVGTQNPVKDFRILLQKGESLEKVAAEMFEVIETLIYLNFDGDFTKPKDAMTCIRDECIKNEPKLYNDWLAKLKKSLAERNRVSLLDLFAESGVDLITRDENAKSDITKDEIKEQNELYENDTVANSTALDIPSDINDFFDEM